MKSFGVKSQNTWPQLVGPATTYFKRYALVAYLSIESEVDTKASNLDIEQKNKFKIILVIVKIAVQTNHL
ncbi:ERF superfamily protein [Borrelia duttonii CR2A]|uniref:ERF superfamily protein n=1 Tax=Borrelia duttonii CR2A TaxID=1432657 RepID=W6TFJ3_9SPIR|nr:ERF superfamily protein [Borrelia duttonii CR2A]